MKKTRIRGRNMYNENATAFRFKLFYLPNFFNKKIKNSDFYVGAVLRPQ